MMVMLNRASLLYLEDCGLVSSNTTKPSSILYLVVHFFVDVINHCDKYLMGLIYMDEGIGENFLFMKISTCMVVTVGII